MYKMDGSRNTNNNTSISWSADIRGCMEIAQDRGLCGGRAGGGAGLCTVLLPRGGGSSLESG
jgi:hypothetical protein